MDPRLGLYGHWRPFESPLEEHFARAFDKYVSPDIVVDTQRELVTRVGKFRLDFFVATRGGRRVGIECDGAEFHDAHRDEWRDAVILAEAHLDAMVRIAGRDLTRTVEGCLGLLARLEPAVFSDRGLTNLETLMLHSRFELGSAHTEIREVHWPVEPPECGDERRHTGAGLVHRVRADITRSEHESPFWTRYARFATRNHYTTLDSMIEAYDAISARIAEEQNRKFSASLEE